MKVWIEEVKDAKEEVLSFAFVLLLFLYAAKTYSLWWYNEQMAQAITARDVKIIETVGMIEFGLIPNWFFVMALLLWSVFAVPLIIQALTRTPQERLVAKARAQRRYERLKREEY